MLKPQDIVIAIKYGTTVQIDPATNVDPVFHKSKPIPSRWFGDQLSLSQGEIIKANKRLVASNLIAMNHSDCSAGAVNTPYLLNVRNMMEFLSHGVKYYLPPVMKGVVIGLPTAWSCPLIKTELVSPDFPTVWESNHGSARGEGLVPLYPGVPVASEKDENLYSLLSIVDILRLGKPRELKVANRLLAEYMESISSAQFQS